MFWFFILLGFSAIPVTFFDVGANLRDENGKLVNGNLTIQIWDSPSGGNLIYEHTFVNVIKNGSWSVIVEANLSYMHKYWKDYKINGEDLDFNGNERLEFFSPFGDINGTFLMNPVLINDTLLFIPVSSPAIDKEGVIYYDADEGRFKFRESTGWKTLSGSGGGNRIEEGNSWVEVDDPGTGKIIFAIDGSERARMTSSSFYPLSSMQLGTSSHKWSSVYANRFYTSSGSSFSPSFVFYTDTDTGIYRPYSNTIGFVLGGRERFRMSTYSFYPTVSNVYNLGSSVKKWKSLYVYHIYPYGYVYGNLKPSYSGRDLGDPWHRWDLYLNNLYPYGKVYGNLIPSSSGKDLGSSSRKWDAYLYNVYVYGSLKPSSSGKDLGDSSHRWDAYLNTVYVYGSLKPSTTGKDLGDTSHKWDLYLYNLYPYGKVYGNLIPSYSGRDLGSSFYKWDAYLRYTYVYGPIYAYNRIKASDGSASFPSYSFIYDSDTGIYRSGYNKLAIAAGGKRRFSIYGSGSWTYTYLGEGSSYNKHYLYIYNLPVTSSGSYLVIYNNRIYRRSSSKLYKDNITDLKVEKEKVFALRPRQYILNNNSGMPGKKDIGLIAEEVEKVLPELVIYENGKPVDVKYEMLSLYLLEVVKEQEKEIAELKEKIKQLESEKAK